MKEIRSQLQKIAVVILAILLVVEGGWNFHDTVSRSSRTPTDFIQDYVAAIALSRGDSIYGVGITELAKQEIGYSGYENFHPPFHTLLVYPLLAFSHENAFLIFAGLTVLLIYLMVFALFREYQVPWRYTCLTFLVLPFWHPLYYCLTNGQSSVLIAAGVIFGWILLRRGRDVLAGCCFGLSISIKLFPGLLLVYLLFRRQWRCLLASLVVTGVLALVSFVCVGFDDSMTYVTTIIAKDVSDWQGFPLNLSPSALIDRLLNRSSQLTQPVMTLPTLAIALQLLVNGALSAAFLYLLYRKNKQQELNGILFSFTCVSMLLLSPITWVHIFPVLFLPVLVLVETEPPVSSEHINVSFGMRLPLVALALLLLVSPLTWGRFIPAFVFVVVIACSMLALHRMSRGTWWIILVSLLLSVPDQFLARVFVQVLHVKPLPWHLQLVIYLPGFGLLLLWGLLLRRVVSVQEHRSP